MTTRTGPTASEGRVEDQIKEQARQFGAWVVGVASAEDVNRYAPKGHRPEDLLKGAKSVIVVGIGVTSAGGWRTGRAREQASVGYNRAESPAVAQRIVGLIERNYGYYAILCPPGSANGRNPYLSLKLLAEMAGLGTRSMAAGIVLNQTYGLLYFGDDAAGCRRPAREARLSASLVRQALGQEGNASLPRLLSYLPFRRARRRRHQMDGLQPESLPSQSADHGHGQLPETAARRDGRARCQEAENDRLWQSLLPRRGLPRLFRRDRRAVLRVRQALPGRPRYPRAAEVACAIA
jgi:hypothetical protein